MTFSFHPEAEVEFIKAIEYYERIESGLGLDFAIEVYSTIKRSVKFPSAWPVIDGEIRRSLVRRFPFGILYAVENESIQIVAVMHLHRQPGYWKGRE